MHDEEVNQIADPDKPPQPTPPGLASAELLGSAPSVESPPTQLDATTSGGHSLGADFRYKKVPVTFQGPRPFPHYLAVRIAPNQFAHPQIYVKLITATPLKSQYRLHRGRSVEPQTPQLVAAAIYESTFEYTEGAPGLSPGDFWVLIIFSDEPITLCEVLIEERNPHEEVSSRTRV